MRSAYYLHGAAFWASANASVIVTEVSVTSRLAGTSLLLGSGAESRDNAAAQFGDLDSTRPQATDAHDPNLRPDGHVVDDGLEYCGSPTPV